VFRISPKGVKAVVDVASLGFILAAILFAANVATFVEADMYLAIVNIFLLTLIALSVALAFGLKLAKFDYTLVIREIQSIALIASLGFCLTAGLQFLILRAATKMAITDVWASKMFYGAAGIAEECFFRLLLLTLFIRLLNGNYLLAATFVSGALFMPYHAAVYGLSNPFLMLAVFTSSMILCLVYVFSGYRVSVSMLVHLAINIFAG